jgi:hypothetical protein
VTATSTATVTLLSNLPTFYYNPSKTLPANQKKQEAQTWGNKKEAENFIKILLKKTERRNPAGSDSSFWS